MNTNRTWIKYALLPFAALLVLSLMTACSSDAEQASDSGSGNKTTGTSEIISPEDARTMLEDSSVVLIDVRTPEEFAEGHIEGALLLPVDEIDEESISELVADKDTPVVLYCRSGRRSADAASKLVQLGYKEVYDLGGINSWPYDVVTGDDA